MVLIAVLLPELLRQNYVQIYLIFLMYCIKLYLLEYPVIISSVLSDDLSLTIIHLLGSNVWLITEINNFSICFSSLWAGVIIT
jgi:hypothetical protein